MNKLDRILRPLASVKLAIVLMALAILLIYAGTIAQIDAENWMVQKRFFHNALVYITLNDLIPHRFGTNFGAFAVPIPGGYGLGLLLLVNLIAAHVVYFKLSWRRLGTILIHLSLIFLLVGEGVRSSMTHEADIQMARWESANYTSDMRNFELAVVDPSPADHDSVTVIPDRALIAGQTIRDPKLPFAIKVDAYYRNSELRMPAGHGTGGAAMPQLEAVELPPRTREGDAPNMPSARVTLRVENQEMPQLLLSADPELPPRAVSVDGKAYVIQLRPQRTYRPYSLYLLNLTHENYGASQIPRNYSSKVRLVDAERGEDREVLIWMNHPMRYRGDALYQSQMLNGDRITGLQVVDNPGWFLPYIACAIGGVGMLVHFTIVLVRFLLEREAPERATKPVLVPLATLVCALAYIAWMGWPPAPRDADGFDSAGFGSVPLLFDGREQPMETLARNSLRILSSRESTEFKGRKISATRWLLDMLARKPEADDYPVFRIDSPDVVHLLDLDPNRKYFSMREVSARQADLSREAQKAQDIKGADRDAFQRSVLDLAGKMNVYGALSDSPQLSLIAPLNSGEKWSSMTGSGTLAAQSPVAEAFEEIVQSYANRQPQRFASEVARCEQLLRENAPALVRPPAALPVTRPSTAASTRPTTAPAAFDFAAFGRLPVCMDKDYKEVQTLDQFARQCLLKLSGAESCLLHGEKHSAIQWLLDVFSDNGQDALAFRVPNPRIRAAMSLPAERELFAPSELAGLAGLAERFAAARAKPESVRSEEDRDLVELDNKVKLYDLLAQWRTQLPLSPPTPDSAKWRPLMRTNLPPAAEAVSLMLDAYKAGRADEFNQHLDEYRQLLDGSDSLARLMGKTRVEMLLNRFDPFFNGVLLYVVALVLGCLSWLFWTRPLGRAALWLVVLTAVYHALGLTARVYVQGRPPVTNLYSSAIFIAFGAALLALTLEVIFRNGIGTVCAAALGAASLLVAHYIALDEGDSMPALEAVLDTNIWLATHVICITLGYAATFLAGFLAILYVLRGVFTESLTPRAGKDLSRAIYGVACFAMIFSFVGTILGGIWADQSWGRFWGWDSKENGAAILVLWIALMLHARWAGLIADRGLAALAIAGNIITAWSWFGTNQLGIGLHSYGFRQGAMTWLLIFGCSQLALIVLANIPKEMWRSGIGNDEG